MNYRSVAELNDDVVAWSRRLPENIDVIVGVPRSGLLVANLLSLHLNRPLTDVDGLLAGRLIAAGKRLDISDALLLGPDRLRILVVDDSVWSGTQMDTVRRRIAAAPARHEVLYGAVYVVPGSSGWVDFHYCKLATPRVFEWNVLHHPALETSCTAIEGVFWPARISSLGTSTAEAERILGDLRPAFRPTRAIGRLVATQPEAARMPICNWLERHAIPYGELSLVPPADPADGRRNEWDVAMDKARFYRHGTAWIFIEGTRERAILLARAAGRPVYSFDIRRLLFPSRRGEACYAPRLYDRLQASAGSVRARVRGKVRALLHLEDIHGVHDNMSGR